MSKMTEAPAPSRDNASVAGNEFSERRGAAQRFPTLVDSPVSHLRNVLTICELLELDRHATTVGRALADIEHRVTAALELLESPAQVPEQADGFRLELEDMDATNCELEAAAKLWQEEG